MVHFIVADPSCPISDSIGIWPYKKLRFTRCNPSNADKVQAGLQGLTGNHVPIFSVKEWEVKANKLLTGK